MYTTRLVASSITGENDILAGLGLSAGRWVDAFSSEILLDPLQVRAVRVAVPATDTQRN